jgi:hypothetical protein
MLEYGQFCPVAKTAEILSEKWTLLIVRELLLGATRFNQIQRAMSKISPTVLNKRHGSRLLVIERVVPEGNEPSEAKLYDINMLVVTGGLERTEREYQKIFQAAGFELTRIIPTKAPVSIVEGVPRAV